MEYTWLGIAAAVILGFSCFAGYKRGFVKEAVSVCYVVLALFVVWLINPYVDAFLREYTPVYDMVQESCRTVVEAEISKAGEEAQSQVINELPLPALLKSQIEENNTLEGYRLLAVDGFAGYVSEAAARMVMNGLGFVLSYLLANIIIRTLVYVLNIISHLPVLRTVNRAAGLLLGGVRGLVVVWIGLLVLTIFCSTSWGSECMDMVNRDVILSFLYDKNPFVRVFMSLFYGNV